LYENILDAPVLLRHLWARVVSGRGLVWLLTGRQFVVILIVLLYLLSPFDVVPEAVFGFVGVLDDLLALLIGLLYLAIIFRGVYRVAARDEPL